MKQFAKVGLGLSLMGAGLWFAFFKSRVFEKLADGTVQTHYDHGALYVGVGVALFGALIVTPDTVAQAVRDAGSLIGRRFSGQQPRQDND